MKTEEKISHKIVPFLWFDNQAEEAANFYVSVFPDAHLGKITRYPNGGPATADSVMTATFYLNGQEFIALNAGPHFKFNEAISLSIKCNTQEEVDYFWEKLTANGGQESPCGWLKDKYGLSWQVTPVQLMNVWSQSDKEKAKRTMQVMMTMKKLDIQALENA